MSSYYLLKNYIKSKKHWVREGAGEQTQSYLAPQPISFLLHYASNMSILDIWTWINYSFQVLVILAEK